MTAQHPDRPSWDDLYLIASNQEGLFTTAQAGEAGFSPQLLAHHLKGGRIARLRHGIYRLVHYPPGEHEDLVATWLWSNREGVVSHQTALALHELSDVLPAHTHLTLPANWRKRRFRLPDSIVLHHRDVAPSDRTWYASVPITTPSRTLNDCARDGLSPELLRQAVVQAVNRGVVTKDELPDVARALRDFGGF